MARKRNDAPNASTSPIAHDSSDAGISQCALNMTHGLSGAVSEVDQGDESLDLVNSVVPQSDDASMSLLNSFDLATCVENEELRYELEQLRTLHLAEIEQIRSDNQVEMEQLQTLRETEHKQAAMKISFREHELNFASERLHELQIDRAALDSARDRIQHLTSARDRLQSTYNGVAGELATLQADSARRSILRQLIDPPRAGIQEIMQLLDTAMTSVKDCLSFASFLVALHQACSKAETLEFHARALTAVAKRGRCTKLGGAEVSIAVRGLIIRAIFIARRSPIFDNGGVAPGDPFLKPLVDLYLAQAEALRGSTRRLYQSALFGQDSALTELQALDIRALLSPPHGLDGTKIIDVALRSELGSFIDLESAQDLLHDRRLAADRKPSLPARFHCERWLIVPQLRSPDRHPSPGILVGFT